MRQLLRIAVSSAGVLLGSLAATPAVAPPTTFTSFAAFFSAAANLREPIDPQMFVAAPGAAAGIGPEHVPHVAGIRNVALNDDKTLMVRSSNGSELGLTVKNWLAAGGTVAVEPLGADRAHLVFDFNHILSGSRYSLFAMHRLPLGGFAPIGGDAGTFNASVGCTARVEFNARLDPGDAIVLVYHSDGQSHGSVPGVLGLNAHIQLVWTPTTAN